MNVGSEILGYEVLATLGYGARSTIFAVKDGQNQVYAMKRVVKSAPSDQRFIDQAIHEHEIAAQLDHSTLRKSYKLYKQRALLRTSEVYVLMELIDGLTLEQYRPDGMAHLCELMILVAQGLHSMHTKGFVHADIKPNNILVTSSDSIKVIDFGQSCPIGTIKQRIQGTPDYIAPEQVLRRQITPQTDLFNFGATIYWLLTGQHYPTLIPKGDPTMTIRLGNGAKPPREVNPVVTPALSQLVMYCLEFEPTKRPDSMEVVIDRLQVAIAQIKRSEAMGNGLPTPQPTSPDSTDGGDGTPSTNTPVNPAPAT